MQNVAHTLVVLEAVIALLLVVTVLVQTPKASGLGGTIGGGDGDAPRAGAPDLLDVMGPRRRVPGLLGREYLGRQLDRRSSGLAV
jgi:protein translocase SecG subunit